MREKWCDLSVDSLNFPQESQKRRINHVEWGR
nr:MAG TPA: hypothetical protein [Caudoviricetes sp.]DAY95639.1 MAG TPA: hypothetical protein [Caudoviricetes sp.]DAY97457.1 MAG TPA: hypothetical protein [Caudoviricetes sp.]DAZ84294.1 MAG TPA: hypothetical protein [Caudoviricetes sp.]